MPKCDSCGTWILFGGTRYGTQRFCNNQCAQQQSLLAFAQSLPDETVAQHIKAVHEGPCPKCKGRGPIDVYVSYRVWSLLLVTSWRNTPKICCRACGFKSQLGCMVFSLLFGWWGFPWGFILTPVQVGRNILGLTRVPNPMAPSPALEKHVRIALASAVAASVRRDELT